MPSPTLNVRPAVPARVTTPFVPVRVTSRSLPPASTSDTEIRFPLPVENTRAVFSFVAWAPGTLFTGASLVAATVSVVVPVSLVSTPSLAINVIDRAVVLGVSEVLLYVTVRSTCW